MPLLREPPALALQRQVVINISHSDLKASSQRVQTAISMITLYIPMLTHSQTQHSNSLKINGLTYPTSNGIDLSGIDDDQGFRKSLLNYLKDMGNLEERDQIGRKWLLETIRQSLSRFEAESFAKAVEVLVAMEDFATLFDLLQAILQGIDSKDMMLCLVDTIEIYLDVWTSMGVLSQFGASLCSIHDRMKSLGLWVRPASELIETLDRAGYVDDVTKTRVHYKRDEVSFKIFGDGGNTYQR